MCTPRTCAQCSFGHLHKMHCICRHSFGNSIVYIELVFALTKKRLLLLASCIDGVIELKILGSLFFLHFLGKLNTKKKSCLLYLLYDNLNMT